MKALFSTLLCSMLVFTSAYAQDLEFGGKLGLNIASWSTNADDAGTRLGWHVGGTASYPLQDALNLNGELLFSMQGVSSKDDDIDGRYNFLYLSIPLLASYQVTPEISAHAGLQPSFLLSAKQKITSPTKRTNDVKDEFSGTDLAFVFGGEYLVQENIALSLRFVFGLNDIVKDDFGEAKNRVVQISGKYLLPIE